MLLHEFHHKVIQRKKGFKRFITRLEKATHRAIVPVAKQTETEVWQQISCTSCANCCKKMTPTLTQTDKKRISQHLGISPSIFTKKYLSYDAKSKDWQMKLQPCVFLDTQTQLCTIYEVRPTDCKGFPHLTKTPLKNYLYIHKQNIEYCPATFLFIEKLMEKVTISNA